MKYFFTFCAIFISVWLSAQELNDNPNLDQVPWYLLERATQQTDAPISSVVTIGNWDNFSLGVDFAENNMAMKPSQPSWFFTAYNTNAPHHTENGIDWTENTVSFSATMRGDPVVAYDSLGNLYYENMYGSPSILGCKVVKSTNNGVTWTPDVTAIAGVDKNWIACDQTAGPYANYVYTTMTASSGGNFARSTNYGSTFTSTFTPTTQSLPGMMVCVGPNGNTQGGSVYVVTNSGSSYAATYTFYRSTDGGATFSQRSQVQWPNYVGTYVNSRNSVQNMRTRPYPMIAADNSLGTHRGKLYCVYASNFPSGSGNKPNIYCRTSADGGSTWGSAVLVNDDVNTQNNHQWHPAVWCDKETGRLYVMWMDTRDTPTSDSAYIYASYSDNGGASFVANQRISNAKMKIDCSTCGGGGTPRYQGDYNGVVSNNKVSMIGWTDFRAGTFQSMTAYFPDFAMSLDHTTHTLYTNLDSATFTVSIPEVKLYSDPVQLTTTITPATSFMTVKYPQGNTLSTCPGSKQVRIVLNGNPPTGNYTVTFTASGPNGTPVHRRTATINVQSGITTPVTVTLQPDRGKCVGDTVHVPIRVTGSNIHDMTFYISYDHSVLTQSGTYYTNLLPTLTASYFPNYNPTTLALTLSAIGSSGINFSATRVINLVFTVASAGSAQLHIRRSPDSSPISYILNSSSIPFISVTYSDNTVTGLSPSQVGVSITSNPVMPACGEDEITFSASVTNGGSSPVFQWKVNGNNAGGNQSYFSNYFITNDQVLCVVTSNLGCTTGNPATSNVIQVIQHPYLWPWVIISPSINPVPLGLSVTFTAQTGNGGSNPLLQWIVNGILQPVTGTTFSYIPLGGDVVSCLLTSSEPCPSINPVSSNLVTISTYYVPSSTVVENVTITGTQCYDALQAITVAGNGTTYSQAGGSQVTMVAGESISFLPAVTVSPGAYLHGYISPYGPFCAILAPPADQTTGQPFADRGSQHDGIRIYPNPTSGILHIELDGIRDEDVSRAEIFSPEGTRVAEQDLKGPGPHAATLLGRAAGVYFIRVTRGNHVVVSKVIVSR